ncbi:lasso peptide biosynthesis PqqD family chaperone [Actinokineospora iranica]|uniref:Coenzyme PQQ synthesis protein D (PqqD) n=1 Tax=Actinokineospora iranica TaxID=1271860 RepID=A0A1G6U6M9_9PSEU|nr:lasso peptide biosynthesis PqqD family chaperone [Actinokineospora iranica]SDD36247.1 Coenzyme PQQ synthesis protein D (PqqD) [Actinokineospora iranica]
MSVSLRAEVSMATSALGAVLLDERTGKYWQLNRSGKQVLETLLAGGTLPDVVAAVTSVYRADPDTVAADAEDLVAHLLSSGLITR